MLVAAVAQNTDPGLWANISHGFWAVYLVRIAVLAAVVVGIVWVLKRLIVGRRPKADEDKQPIEDNK